MSKWLDVVLGREQTPENVSVMQPGPVQPVRRDGLLAAVGEPLSYAPGPLGMLGTAAKSIGDNGLTGLASTAADVTLGMFGGKAGPMMRRIAAGDNARAIPKNAKTWMGMDDRMRWELSDRGAKIEKGIDAFPDGATLDKVLTHNELFKQYPELKGYRVMPLTKAPNGAESIQNGAIGAHDAKNKIIYLKPGLDKTAQLSTLLHELQHGVQTVEGHVTGASSTESMHLAMNMMDKYRAETDPKKKRLLRAQIKDTFEWDPDGDRSIKALANKIYSKKYGEVEARTTQERHRLTTQMTDRQIANTFGDYTDVMGMEEPNPVLWQDVWKKMFGYRELPPFVNVQSGKIIPITDY